MKKNLFGTAAFCMTLLLSVTACADLESVGTPAVSTASSATSNPNAAVSTDSIPTSESTAETTAPISQTDFPDTLPPALSTTTAALATTAAAVITAAGSTTADITPPVSNASIASRVASMPLERKIAQMIMASSNADTKAAKGGAGALCFFAGAFKDKNKTQVISMIEKVQSYAEIPMLISVDEEGGNIVRISSNTKLRKSPFLSPSKVYASGGWDAVKTDTAEKANLLLSLGINSNLAPVCDVPLSKNDYIYSRCFSMDAKETAEYITNVVTVMNQKKIACTLKHFPGYGGSADTHKGKGVDSRDYSAFEQSDFLPFIAGIQAGAGSVMISHNIVKCMDADNPASLSPKVHEILRNTLGFQGVIITDDLDMGAVSKFYSVGDGAVKAVEAGNDMLCTSKFSESVSAIQKAVESGQISESRIDASVTRILKWKQDLSLID